MREKCLSVSVTHSQKTKVFRGLAFAFLEVNQNTDSDYSDNYDKSYDDRKLLETALF
jgi:hypothetical protein